MIKTINVREFSTKLVNRNKLQGDGLNTAIEFRETYLQDLMEKDWWDNPKNTIILDFSGVQKMSPSFADEAFGYFTQFATPDKVRSQIQFENLSKVQEMILDMELTDAYRSVRKNA